MSKKFQNGQLGRIRINYFSKKEEEGRIRIYRIRIYRNKLTLPPKKINGKDIIYFFTERSRYYQTNP